MSMLPENDSPFWQVRGICDVVLEALHLFHSDAETNFRAYNALYQLICSRLGHGWYGERNNRYHDLKRYMDDAATSVYPTGALEAHRLIVGLLKKADQRTTNVIENYMLEKYVKRLQALLG